MLTQSIFHSAKQILFGEEKLFLFPLKYNFIICVQTEEDASIHA